MKQFPHPNSRQRLGKYGEDLAAEYLTKHGYLIIEHNFKARYGELDLIALKNKQLIFIEVKTRIGTAYGLPEEAITKRKLDEVKLTAAYYFTLHPELPSFHRIDAVAILLYPDRTIKDFRHIENITQ